MTDFLDSHFIIAVCFIIFVYFSYKPIKKAILGSLDSKIKEIQDKIEETERLKKEAKVLLEEVEKEMSDFEERKKNILESAKVSTSRLVETKVKEIDLMLRRTKDSALKSIETKRLRANDQLRREFTDSVLSMVRTYLTETKNNSTSDKEILEYLSKK